MSRSTRQQQRERRAAILPKLDLVELFLRDQFLRVPPNTDRGPWSGALFCLRDARNFTSNFLGLVDAAAARRAGGAR